MSRNKIIIIAVASVLIFGVIGALTMFHSSPHEDSTGEVTSVPLKINGLDNQNYVFSSDTQKAIVLGIDQYLKADNIKTNGMEGIVRKDSYTKTETDDTTIATLLIDIPSAKRTYKVSSSGSGDPDGDNRLLILCPTPEELKYGKFDCKDDTL